MIGQINKDSQKSGYFPTPEVAAFTAKVKEDYALGTEILERQWRELNLRSVLEDENIGQRMFNAFVKDTVEDPMEEWKHRGTRSHARNKGIAMHAQLTGNYLLPVFMAQNDQDETDRDFSEVMRSVIEWMAAPTNSNYQESFLNVTFGMIQNPVTFLGAEYYEVFQKIKTYNEKKERIIKEIIDETLSGFKTPVYSSSQILITNAYERNIQKQRRIIKRRYCEKEELEAIYGVHPYWPYVRKGIRTIYSETDGLFYDIADDQNPNLIAEETALSRAGDSEVCFLNGIYMGDVNNVDNNPIRHRDMRGAPKYNITPFGYSRIGQHFFYYKSMMNVLQWDNRFYDAMSEVVMNRAMLETEIPVVVTGSSDKIDSEIVFPNSVQIFESPNTKVFPLLPSSNMAAGFQALRETEKSMENESVSDTIAGQLPEPSQKAYSVATAQANAKKLIGAVPKSLAESVIRYGDLMKDIALNHITIPQVEELLGGGMKLRYKTLTLNQKMGYKKIRFDGSLIGKDMSEDQKTRKSLELLKETGYPDRRESILLVNPELVAKFRYLCYVDIEEMSIKNNEYWQPILANLYTLLANNPFIKQDELTRELVYSHFQSRTDDFMQTPPSLRALPLPIQNGNQYGNMVQGKKLAGAMTNAVQ